MSLYDDFYILLEKAILLHGNANKLAEHLGVNSNLITRWKKKEREPLLSSAQIILDIFGAELLPANEKDIDKRDAIDVNESAKLKQENENLKREIARLEGKLEVYKEVAATRHIETDTRGGAFMQTNALLEMDNIDKL